MHVERRIEGNSLLNKNDRTCNSEKILSLVLKILLLNNRLAAVLCIFALYSCRCYILFLLNIFCCTVKSDLQAWVNTGITENATCLVVVKSFDMLMQANLFEENCTEGFFVIVGCGGS